MYDFNLNIPKITLLLIRKDNKKVAEIVLEKMLCDLKKGIEFLDAKFSLH
jgi:hypothetical protein